MNNKTHFMFSANSYIFRQHGAIFRDFNDKQSRKSIKYEGWNFNSGNYLFTTDTK